MVKEILIIAFLTLSVANAAINVFDKAFVEYLKVRICLANLKEYLNRK